MMEFNFDFDEFDFTVKEKLLNWISSEQHDPVATTVQKRRLELVRRLISVCDAIDSLTDDNVPKIKWVKVRDNFSITINTGAI